MRTLAALLLMMGSNSALALDADALIERLAKPAPATVPFVEIRFSPMLEHALVVSGELGYASATALDRRVTQPYRETTEIRGESVRVVREGEPPRSFALRRAPELQALLASFTALLNGDPQQVRQRFAIEAAGSNEHWHMKLTPTDSRAARRMERIDVTGQNDQARCFVFAADRATSFMLLDQGAQVELPTAVTREWAEQHCQSR